MVFIREDISAKFLSAESKSIGSHYKEVNFCKKKHFLSFLQNPYKNNTLDALGRNFDLYSSEYEGFFLLRDFIVEPKERCMQSFFQTLWM